jgi:hypothetical protein
MKRSIILLGIVALVTIGTFTVFGQNPEKARPFLSGLHEGQAVTLKEVAGRYEITVMDNMPGPLGYKIVEVGPDYLTVVDIAGVAETRFPIYSIKAIVRLKLPKM